MDNQQPSSEEEKVQRLSALQAIGKASGELPSGRRYSPNSIER